MQARACPSLLKRKLDLPTFKRTVGPAVPSPFPAAPGPTEDNADIDAELQPYLDGSKLPPTPTYFIGAYGHGCATALEALQQSGSAGLTYLGRSGLETLQGLRVAFLDGTHSSLEYTQGTAEHSSPGACRHFTKVSSSIPALSHPGCFPHPGYLAAQEEAAVSFIGVRHTLQEDVQALELAAEEAIGDVDILLTCEWPADVTAATPPGSAPSEASTAGKSLRAGSTAGSNANNVVPTLLCCRARPGDITLSLAPGKKAADAAVFDAGPMLCPSKSLCC